jgi:hypothetical protein
MRIKKDPVKIHRVLEIGPIERAGYAALSPMRPSNHAAVHYATGRLHNDSCRVGKIEHWLHIHDTCMVARRSGHVNDFSLFQIVGQSNTAQMARQNGLRKSSRLTLAVEQAGTSDVIGPRIDRCKMSRFAAPDTGSRVRLAAGGGAIPAARFGSGCDDARLASSTTRVDEVGSAGESLKPRWPLGPMPSTERSTERGKSKLRDHSAVAGPSITLGSPP